MKDELNFITIIITIIIIFGICSFCYKACSSTRVGRSIDTSSEQLFVSYTKSGLQLILVETNKEIDRSFLAARSAR